jgi:nitric oxide reductase subunit B
MWYARSPEFMQTTVVEVFRWLRVVGDTVFAIGALMFAWFVFTVRPVPPQQSPPPPAQVKGAS